MSASLVQAELFAGPTPSRAVLSACGRYRYRLERVWDTGRAPLVFVMLNPSTADAVVDDPTIRRCRGFAVREGCGGLVVVNLYALRATDPSALARDPDPVGPENVMHVEAALCDARGPIVCAWGSKVLAPPPATLAIVAHSSRPLFVLGTTREGAPRHPLYIRSDAPLLPWRP